MRHLLPWLLLGWAAPSLAQEEAPEPEPAEEAAPEPADEPEPEPDETPDEPVPELEESTDPPEPAPALPPPAPLPPPRSRSGVVDRVAAVVDDEVIALSEVYDIGGQFIEQSCPGRADACFAGKELEVLDALIRRTLVRQELARLDLRVSAADIDQAIDQTVRQYGLADRQALRAEIERTGKTWADYREEIGEFLRDQRFQVRVLAPRVTVNDDELRDLYQRTARAVKKPVVEISALGIVLPADADAQLQAEMTEQAGELVGALNAGELTYVEAVDLYDGAGLSTVFGGKEFKRGTLLGPVDGVVFDAEVGTFLDPIRVGDVLFLLRVDSRVEKVTDEVQPFEEIEEDLRNQVFQRKLQDAEEEWYQRARREAAIDVKIEVRS